MLSQDFIDILSAFTEESVEYLLVGSYAMAFHGFSRATGDIDLWIRPSEENATRVWHALEKFGAPVFDLNRDDLKTDDMVFQIGIAPNRIDILTKIEAVDFDEAWNYRKITEIQGLIVPVIGQSHLVTNKKATDRPKDRLDVMWMEGGESGD